jgi:phosphatidylserine/phosphatidylglycerophosphate/cardiolipin synthase-like enzyme
VVVAGYTGRMQLAKQEVMERLILSPSERRQTILDLLRSARRRVVLSLFRCDDELILDEITAAPRRNVEVKVLITPRARGWAKRLGGLVTLLRETGVDVRKYDGPLAKYHAKYIVADDRAALIGSLNLTRKCFESTCDFALVSQRPDLISGLTTLFYFDWHAPDVPLPEISDRLIVGPDQTRRRIIPFLEQAQSTIRIIDHRVTEPQVLLTLAKKMKEGVRVQILGRGEVGDLMSHGKMILIDGHVGIFGSASLSKPGLDIRREVAVVIDDAAHVGRLSRFFEEAAVYTPVRAQDLDPDDDENDDDDE